MTGIGVRSFTSSPPSPTWAAVDETTFDPPSPRFYFDSHSSTNSTSSDNSDNHTFRLASPTPSLSPPRPDDDFLLLPDSSLASSLLSGNQPSDDEAEGEGQPAPTRPLLVCSPTASDSLYSDSASSASPLSPFQLSNSVCSPVSSFPSPTLSVSSLSLPASFHSSATPTPAPTPAPSSSVSTSDSASRPRFVSRKVACQVCHFAKVRCEGGRPCERCVRFQHTAHCTDRPSKRGEKKRKRSNQNGQSELAQPSAQQEHSHQDELQTHWSGVEAAESGEDAFSNRMIRATGATAARLSSSSPYAPIPRHLIPSFAARHMPVDSARLSSLFLNGHLQWFSTLSESELTVLMSRMHLRDKLLQGVWMHNILTPADMMRLSHSLPPNRNWWRKYFKPHDRLLQLPDGHIPLFQQYSGQLGCGLGSAVDSGSVVRPHGLCDGRVCYGFCVFLDAFTAATSCRISFDRSPLQAMADQSNAPNTPFIAIRRLHNEDVARSQEAMVEALCRQMSDSMRLDEAASSNSWSEQHHADDAPSTHSDTDQTVTVHGPPIPVTSLAVSMSAQCNSAFERLLGYSQSDLRQLFLTHGDAAIYALFAPDDWAALMQLDKDVKLRQRDEYRLFVTALSMRRERVACLLYVQNEFDRDGKLCVTYLSFTPLPDECSYSTRKRMADETPSMAVAYQQLIHASS